MKNTILITGFEPFGKSNENVSGIIAEGLKEEDVNGYKTQSEILPVEFKRASAILLEKITEHDPGIVLSIGERSVKCGNKNELVNLELYGYNEMNSINPDNAGYNPDHEVIIKGEKEVLSCNWPAGELISHLRKQDFICSLSEDPGRYVCNDLIYRTNHHIEKANSAICFGFLHIPKLKDMIGNRSKGSVSFEEIRCLIRSLLQYEITYHSKVK